MGTFNSAGHVYKYDQDSRHTTDNSHGIPSKELIVAEQPAFTRVVLENNKRDKIIVIIISNCGRARDYR